MPEERYCQVCQKKLVRKPKESNTAWKNRKCCDRVCAAKSNKQRHRDKGIVQPRRFHRW